MPYWWHCLTYRCLALAFQIKNFTSIVASIVNHMRGATSKISDFQPGSVARTLVEGPAVEVEELYLKMFIGLREAIPVATFKSFNFDPLPAAYACGYVSVSSEVPLAQDILIPAGTKFTAEDGRTYSSKEAVTWETGSSLIRIKVIADTIGAAGNIATGGINSSPMFGAGYTVSNTLIENGRDIESIDERELRFAEFVAALSRGTKEACLYYAKQTVISDDEGNTLEYVTRTGFVEGGGFVRIYVYTSNGLASNELLFNGQRRIDGWRDPVTNEVTDGVRAGGVRVDILRMIETEVPFSARVKMLPGYTLTAAIEQQLFDTYAMTLSGVMPSEVLYVGTIVEQLLDVPGVESIVPDSNANIVCQPNEVLIAGAFTMTAL